MASKVYNEFKYRLLKGDINLSSGTIKAALLSTNTTADTENSSKAYVGDIGTLDEFDGANYARKTLSNKTFSKSDGSSLGKFTADNLTWTALGAGTRGVQGVLLLNYVTNDAASHLISWHEYSSTKTMDGSDFTSTWDGTNGIITLT